MSQVALHNESQLPEPLHDELALQAYLFKAHMKSRWEALEAKWGDLKEHLSRAQITASDAKPNINGSTKVLADTLTAGYTELKSAFKH